MPFPWLHPSVPAPVRATFHKKSLDMYRQEVRQRATLLRHLGHSEKDAAARCRQNLAWDFEINGKCPVIDEVDRLVKDVYRTR